MRRTNSVKNLETSDIKRNTSARALKTKQSARMAHPSPRSASTISAPPDQGQQTAQVPQAPTYAAHSEGQASSTKRQSAHDLSMASLRRLVKGLPDAASLSSTATVGEILHVVLDLCAQNSPVSPTLSEPQAIEIVRHLLAAGADINACSPSGATLLWYAAKEGYADLVALLIAHKANIDASTAGQTALMLAARSGHGKIIDLLLKNGAQLETKSDHGATALTIASSSGHAEIVKALLDAGADIHTTGHLKATPLHSAAEHGDMQVAKILIERGIYINARTEEGYCALDFAASYGKINVLKFLIEQGAKLQVPNNVGQTALHLAAGLGQLEAIKVLIKMGANPKALDQHRRTPFECAVDDGQLAVLGLLTEMGGDINAVDEDGRTALHRAVGHSKGDAVRTLVKLGANINAKSRENFTALQLAAAYGKSEEIVRTLVELNADLEAKGNDGQTALHLAVLTDNLAISRCLIESGANINALDSIMRTPLMYSVDGKQAGQVELLLQRRADLNTKDNQGYSALQHATHLGQDSIVTTLVERGAQFDVPPKPAKPSRFARAPVQQVEPYQDILERQIEHVERTRPQPLGFDAYQVLKSTLHPFQAKEEALSDTFSSVGQACESIVSGKCKKENLHHLIGLAAKSNTPIQTRNKLARAFALARVCGHYSKLKGLRNTLGETYRTSKAQFETLKENINRQLENGFTLLTQAAVGNDPLMVKVLVRLGAKIDMRDRNSNTAVLAAAKANAFAAYIELISLGANADDQDFQGKSSLYFLTVAFEHADHARAMLQLFGYLNNKGFHFDHPNPDAKLPTDPPTLADRISMSDRMISGLMQLWQAKDAKASSSASSSD